MTSKEFDLFMALILELLKNGQAEKVIQLLEENRRKENNNE